MCAVASTVALYAVSGIVIRRVVVPRMFKRAEEKHKMNYTTLPWGGWWARREWVEVRCFCGLMWAFTPVVVAVFTVWTTLAALSFGAVPFPWSRTPDELK